MSRQLQTLIYPIVNVLLLLWIDDFDDIIVALFFQFSYPYQTSMMGYVIKAVLCFQSPFLRFYVLLP